MRIPSWPWVALNLLRLTGAVALSWLIVAQFILLGIDAQQMTGADRENASQYYGESTVPMQAGSGFFMVLSRIFMVASSALLLLGQIGIPEMWLYKRVPWLGPSCGTLWLAIGELWLCTELQRHKISTVHLIPAWMLFGVGLMNLLLAIILWVLSRRLPPHPSPALIFNYTQRLAFCRPPPPVYAALLPHHDANISQAHSTDVDGLSDVRWREQYPTFTGRGLDDPEAAIPKSLLHTDMDVSHEFSAVAHTTPMHKSKSRHGNRERPKDAGESQKLPADSSLPTSRRPKDEVSDQKRSGRRLPAESERVAERPPRGPASSTVRQAKGGADIKRKQSASVAIEDLRSSFPTPPVRTGAPTVLDAVSEGTPPVSQQGDDRSTNRVNGRSLRGHTTSIAERRGSVVAPALRLRTTHTKRPPGRQESKPVTAPSDSTVTAQSSREASKQMPRSSMAPSRAARSAPAHRSVRFKDLHEQVDVDAGGEKALDDLLNEVKPATHQDQTHAMHYNSDSSAYSGIAGSDTSTFSNSPPLTAIPPPMIARASSNDIDPHREDEEITPTALRPPPRRRSSSASQSARARMIIATMETPQQVPEVAPKSAPMLGPTYLDGSSGLWEQKRRPSSASIGSTFSGLSGWSYKSSDTASIRRRSSGDTNMSSPEEDGFWARARRLTAAV